MDGDKLNRTLLRLMLAVRGRQHLSLHVLESRTGIKRMEDEVPPIHSTQHQFA